MDRKVLVADVPEVRARVAAVLAHERLVFVHTLAAALSALARDDFDLVLIGMHFDDSRMFELLRYVRTLHQHKEVPVVCVQCEEVMLSEAVLKNMEDAVKALGGNAFVDLRDHSHVFRSHCDFLNKVATQAALN